MGSFESVQSFRLLPGRRRVCSSAFSPFPYALVVVGFVPVGSVHSRPLCGSFGCVQSIPVRPGGHWVCVGAFGPFLYALEVVGAVQVRSVLSCAP